LFAGGDNHPARHKLNFSLSVVEANDSDVPAEGRGVFPTDTLLSGYSTLLMTNMDYGWQGSRVRFGITGASVMRYYSALESVQSVSYTVGVGASARLAGRTMLFANQSVAYLPSYLYGLFPRETVTSPGTPVPPAPDYAVTDTESYSYSTTVTLTRGLSRRSHVSATGEFQYTDFLHQTTRQPDLHSESVRAEYSRNLARKLALRVGYRYRSGTFGYGSALGLAPDLSATEHGPDIGLTYTRPVSATRQIALGFNAGSSAVSLPGLSTGDSYRPYGELTVAWQFSRAWQVRGTGRRGLEYVAGLSAPVFVDSVVAELAGLLHPRLNVFTSARYSSGASALSNRVQPFDSYSGDFQIRFALNRELSFYGGYLYYFYDFQGTGLAPGIPPSLERNGVRAGLTVWVPALRR
jgi:hypothetical protein